MDKDHRSLEHKIRDVVEASMNRNTELRRKVVNVGRPDTAPSNFDPKSKLAKQGEIKTKIIDEAGKCNMTEAGVACPMHGLKECMSEMKKVDETSHMDKDKKEAKKDDDKESKAGPSKAEDKFTGGKTEVDFEPKTNDKTTIDSDDKSKKTDKKMTKEETEEVDEAMKFKVTTKKHGTHDVSVPDHKAKTEAEARKHIENHPMYAKYKPTKIERVKEETMLKSDNKFGLPQDLIDAVTEAMMKKKPTEEELKGNQHKLDKNHNGKIDGQDFKILRGTTKEEVDIDEAEEINEDLGKHLFHAVKHLATAEIGDVDNPEKHREKFKAAVEKVRASHGDKAAKDFHAHATQDAHHLTGSSAAAETRGSQFHKHMSDSEKKTYSKHMNKLLGESLQEAKTGNEGHGYHGQAYSAAKGDDKMGEAGKAYSKAHSLVKKHAADHLAGVKNPNKMVTHYLDSKHGRHLHGNENNAAYVKKDFGHFKKGYKPEMHEEVEQIDELSKDMLSRYAKKATTDRWAKMPAKGDSDPMKRGQKHFAKRMKGANLAHDKMDGTAKVKATEEVNLSAEELARIEEIVKALK